MTSWFVEIILIDKEKLQAEEEEEYFPPSKERQVTIPADMQLHY